MGFFARLFGVKPAVDTVPDQEFALSQQLSQQSVPANNPPGSQAANRRELLRVVLRDTLNRHGIPTAWIVGQTLVATSRGREQGIHWRLVVKHWDPRLPTHMVGIQNHLIKRAMSFDPMASTWLVGIAWQFVLEDESACPELPHPGIWTSVPNTPAPVRAPITPLGGSGDVIEGPIRIRDQPAAEIDEHVDSAREDLERLFAIRDADMRRHSQDNDVTQPMYAATEPAKL
jgi:hypothetical protein